MIIIFFGVGGAFAIVEKEIFWIYQVPMNLSRACLDDVKHSLLIALICKVLTQEST
jgi:hypothetical protein